MNNNDLTNKTMQKNISVSIINAEKMSLKLKTTNNKNINKHNRKIKLVYATGTHFRFPNMSLNTLYPRRVYP